MVEKEFLVLLRMLDICYTMLISRYIKVLNSRLTLARLIQLSGLNGRLGKWTELLSNGTLEIHRCERASKRYRVQWRPV